MSTSKRSHGSDRPRYTQSTQHSDTDDLITELVKDHNELRAMFDSITDTPSDEKRQEVARQIITELVRHSVAEEQYLYPATRRALPDGDTLADHEIAEHSEVERMLSRLEKTPVEDPAFATLVSEIISSVLHHVREEEEELFPRLRAALDEDELARLGDAVRLAKRTAPTHPHPSTPDTPPLNLVGDPVIGLVDRVRDALSGR